MKANVTILISLFRCCEQISCMSLKILELRYFTIFDYYLDVKKKIYRCKRSLKMPFDYLLAAFTIFGSSYFFIKQQE